jgi:hypothetical protein
VLRSGPESRWRKLRLKVGQVNSAGVVLAEVTEDLPEEAEDLEKVEDLEVAADLAAADLPAADLEVEVLEEAAPGEVALEVAVLEEVVLEQVVLEEINRRPTPA